MFIVDKAPYKYITVDLTTGQPYVIDSALIFDKYNGACAQLIAAVSGDASAQINYRVDPDTDQPANNGLPLMQYGSVEFKSTEAIKNLRFYCASTATLYLILMR